MSIFIIFFFFFFQAEDGIRDRNVTGVQTCALPIWISSSSRALFRASSSGQAGSRTPLSTTISLEASAEIGRASCRERVEMPGGAGVGKKKTTGSGGGG